MVSGAIDVSKAGNEIGKISVKISYRIIDLFSGHLYSSPTKAIEELVVNSYDAFANICSVYLPQDWSSGDEKILVYDDGDSMDEEGLRTLWLIAEGIKRTPENEEAAIKRGRAPIGKFGIGKLASYVIGRRISHICKKNGKYLAVTMDYSDLNLTSQSSTDVKALAEGVNLSIRELTLVDLKKVVQSVLPDKVNLPLITSDSPKNWTLVIIDHCKDYAKEIKEGRLEWVISTALPLDPTFKVFVNDAEILPSKLDEPKHCEWTIGVEDKVAEDLKFKEFNNPLLTPPFNKGIEIPGIGHISGKFELYKPTITSGKAVDSGGRNNGFFIVVRKRLVNLDDSLFGSHPLSHSTFNRFRGIIYADGLDKFLVSSREGVTQQGYAYLKQYLEQKFYEVRNTYEKIEQVQEKLWPESLENLPGDLVKFPMNHALERSDKEDFTPWLIRRPAIKVNEQTSINAIELETLQPSDPLGVFDTEKGIVKANKLHPFISNFPDDKSFKNWAAVEAMTEAYMLDTGLDPENVRVVLEKRDRLMRVLVRCAPQTAGVVAENILETTSSDRPFEIACARGLEILGLDVSHIGGPNQPDGIATAHLGLGGDRESRQYVLLYDAKSSIHERVKASNLNTGGVKRHRKKYLADFSLIIAPDFQGDDEAAAVKEAEEEVITLLRARDFADLIEVSAVKPLSLTKLRELFATCRSPDQAHDWIQEFKAESERIPPINLVLQTIWELQSNKPKDPVSFGAIKWKAPERFFDFSEQSIAQWLRSLQKLVPEILNVTTKYVFLNQAPDVTCKQIQLALGKMRDKELGKPITQQLNQAKSGD